MIKKPFFKGTYQGLTGRARRQHVRLWGSPLLGRRAPITSVTLIRLQVPLPPAPPTPPLGDVSYGSPHGSALGSLLHEAQRVLTQGHTCARHKPRKPRPQVPAFRPGPGPALPVSRARTVSHWEGRPDPVGAAGPFSAHSASRVWSRSCLHACLPLGSVSLVRLCIPVTRESP